MCVWTNQNCYRILNDCSNWISVCMEHVFGRNPMFSGTRKDYYFHYSDLSCSEISKLSCSAMQADVCGDY